MFYSHEILTSRKHGVATVWLVATLGNRASPKKVNRKTILEVDIPKACDVVIQPDAPMALRLQSNLLCGISRVYAQQCSYVLVDAQSVQQQMRQLFRAVQAQSNDLDVEVGRSTRPEQLLLSDDPNFLPDIELQLDLNLLDIDSHLPDSSQTERLLSSQANKVSSQSSVEALLDLQFPSSSSGAGGGLDFPSSGPRAGASHMAATGPEPDGEGDIFLPQAEFAFDPDGNIFDVSEAPVPAPPAPSSTRIGAVGYDEPNALAMEPEPSASLQAAGAMPEISIYGAEPAGQEPGTTPAQPSEGYQPSQEATYSKSEETATAAARRAKPRKNMETDTRIEISRTELVSWSTNYLANMDTVRHKREAIRAGLQSKKNAEWWVWGAGIGGIGYDMRGLGKISHPLAMFQGQQLREMILGPTSPSKKRGATDAESDDQGRRVRRRSGGPDGQQASQHDKDIVMGDQAGEPDEPEIARGASTPDERQFGPDLSSSNMPWNTSASALAQQQGRGGAGSRASGEAETFQRGRPGSRLTSASPLVGRGFPRRTTSRQSSLGPVVLGEPPDAFSSGNDDFGGADLEFDEYDRFGPAAEQDTPQQSSQWVRTQLDLESTNFLEFVKTGIAEHGRDAYAAGLGEERRGVPFEELLDPATNTHVVAAQGLLHVLTLASKGVLWVSQGQMAFGEEMVIGLASPLTHDRPAPDQVQS